MSDSIKTAEHFYAVAEVLKRDAEFTLQCVDMLLRHADQLSAWDIRDAKLAEALGKPESEVTK